MPKQSQLKILIVAKQNKAGLHAARKLEKLLREYTEDIHFDLSTVKKARNARGTPIKKFDGDFIITVGGDGTLLWTAQQTTKPILPVRIEGYGFLCTADFKDLCLISEIHPMPLAARKDLHPILLLRELLNPNLRHKQPSGSEEGIASGRSQVRKPEVF
jgi:hypothetical protein